MFFYKVKNDKNVSELTLDFIALSKLGIVENASN